MALATQCPHCHTTFRVASDQLKLRGGIVRCGACQSIFDGNAHLIDLDALAASKAAAAQAEAAEAGEAAAPVHTLDFDHAPDALDILPEPEAAPASEADAEPETKPEAEGVASAPAHADEVLGVDVPDLPDLPDLPEPESEAEAGPAAASEPAPAPEPESVDARAPAPAAHASQDRIEPRFDLPVDEEIVAQPLPGVGHADFDEPVSPAADAASVAPDVVPDVTLDAAPEVPPAALPLRASAAGTDSLAPPLPAAPKSARTKNLEARARRSRLTPTNIDAPKLRVPANSETDEPEFVKRSRKQEQSGRTRRLLMLGGAVALALLLAAQAVLGWRNVLAARYPGARPLLGAACALLGCRVGLPAQVENLVIETGELSTLGVDTYSLNTLLRNQGSLVQAWPSIQLELTDANDKPLLRRVFGPAEYLPQGVSAANGFAAHSEQPVRLNFALSDIKPSSYHMIVFYQDSP